MSQSLQKLQAKVSDLNHIIQERGDGLVQQVISSPHYLCFQTRFKGKTLYLYLGRGGTHQGFDFSEQKIPAFLRIQDRYLQFARKWWRGMRLRELSVTDEDRVLILEGFKEKANLKISLLQFVSRVVGTIMSAFFFSNSPSSFSCSKSVMI